MKNKSLLVVLSILGYTSAVRATFIIDDKGILRAMVYYPMTNGRSIDEFVRGECITNFR